MRGVENRGGGPCDSLSAVTLFGSLVANTREIAGHLTVERTGRVRSQAKKSSGRFEYRQLALAWGFLAACGGIHQKQKICDTTRKKVRTMGEGGNIGCTPPSSQSTIAPTEKALPRMQLTGLADLLWPQNKKNIPYLP